MHAAATDRLQLEADLRGALAGGQLAVHYQPTVTLDGQQPIGAEALLRWFHPDRGPVPPDVFIPIAEEAGLIGEIGAWVLREACRQNAAWQETFGAGFAVAVNISPTQLLEEGVVATVQAALEDAGLPASCLVLEITEAVLMTEVDTVVARLESLKQLGVRIAIDDFGTGYSSLNYLRRLPIDVLKIDRSFVNAVEATPRDRSLVASLLDLGRTLQLELVAEGIEDEVQRDWLSRNGCQLGQGYYFARPMQPTAMAELLAEWRVASIPAQRTG